MRSVANNDSQRYMLFYYKRVNNNLDRNMGAMTLDEWIDELRYGDLDSIKDRLDAIELLEFLEELKKLRDVVQNDD